MQKRPGLTATGASAFWGQEPVELGTPLPPEGQPAPDAAEAAPVGSHAGSPPPEPQAATNVASATKPTAAKDEELEAIKKAVDDAASVGGGLWLSYLFVLFYLAVAAGAVTHADLFLENPVKLPFLNVELPLLAFFFLAPILFLFVHAYTLVHLVFLTDKAKRFDEAVRRPGASEDGLRQGLPSNIFIQFLAGPPNARAGPFGWLLRLIAWSTLAVAPILLLLLFQVQFLPFHNSFITWTQRLVLLADLALLWWLWHQILARREPVIERPWARRGWWVTGLVLTACTALFSWGLATFPGEWQTERFSAWRPIHERDQQQQPIMVSIHDWLFESRIDDTTRHRRWPLSSTLVLTGFNIYEGLKIDDPDKLKGRDFVFRARGRDLKGVIFDLAVLPKVDFEGAELQGASLDYVQLQGASFSRAQLQGAPLFFAQLQGASLFQAQLQGASLFQAQLQGASLFQAQLQGASLDDAQLQGASFVRAQLQGASLNQAQLQGAALERTKLQGASLQFAQLQGASLEAAFLDATDLSDAWLWRTNVLTPPGFPNLFSHVFPTDLLPSVSWGPSWRDTTWSDKAYQNLRKAIEALPRGDARDEALERVGRLDCGNPDKTLAACDPSVPRLPPEADVWRQALKNAGQLDKKVYAEALAKTLKALVCSGGGNVIYVVRGLGFQARLSAAGAGGAALINDITSKDSKDCPVSASLTDADRANLLRVKQAIEKAGN
jgi:uncharacterized protein YjbI with pentapeptide repeats